MKTNRIAGTDLIVSCLGYGAVSLASWDRAPVKTEERRHAARLIHTAIDQGITLFDHADLYAFGKCEEVFGSVLRNSPGLRDRAVIQSKCGQILPDGWLAGQPIPVNLSRPHILSAVEGSLRRLGTDRLDILLLHAPDALAEPEDVAQAFDDLHRTGKVRYFGVSNHNAAQISLLRRTVRQPIVVNQIQLSLAHVHPLVDGMDFTIQLASGRIENPPRSRGESTGTVDYCRQHGIQLQAWWPLRKLVAPPAGATTEIRATAQRLSALASEKGTTPGAIALAWILRHPAGIVPIIGSSNVDHLAENCAADGVSLSREEWYSLFVGAAGQPSSPE